MATIETVANRAKVSTTTVSNVINGKTKRVSEATIERVQAIIREIGYSPNMSARALSTRNSKVVALISHMDPEKSGDFMDDPFMTRFISAVESTLREKGYYIMLRSIASREDLQKFLANWNVDGLFFTGLFEDDDLYIALREMEKPIVLADSYLSDYGCMVNIGLDDVEGALLATRHLIQKGHTRIVFAGPPIHSGGVVEKRLEGYKAALAEADLPFDPALVRESEFKTKDTLALGVSIAKQTDVTAVFATADVMAAGIMAGIREGGRRIPEDVSIVGFDDLNWCQLTSPRLTTIHQNMRRKGQLAADLMVTLLEGGRVKEHNIILPVHLVERESVFSLQKRKKI